MGVLGLSTGVADRVVFNLGLPTVMGLAGVNCYMVGDLLLNRFPWLPVLPLLLPNPASVLLAAQGIPLSKVAWDSTRVIRTRSTSTRSSRSPGATSTPT